MEKRFENEKQEFEKTILALEEQSQQREQKYSVRSIDMFFDSESEQRIMINSEYLY